MTTALSEPGVAALARPASTGRSAAAVALVGAIGALPLLLPFGLPPGPGNTAPPDVMLVVLIIVTGIWAVRGHRPLRFPYALPTALIMLAGLLAAITVETGGADSLLTVVRDLFVFLWAVCLATLSRDDKLLRTALVSWAVFGTLYAAAMTFGVFADIDALSGKTAGGGERAAFTFGDSNYPANYFLTALFILRAMQWPRHRGWRTACCAILVTGIVLTLSNGGMLALGVAVVAGMLFRLVKERKAAHAVVVMCLGALCITPLAFLDVSVLVQKAAQVSPFLRDSVGRLGEESTATRGALLSEELDLLSSGRYPFGVGPGRTLETLREQQYPYVNEAHNDYVAAVVERGPLGGLAVVVLVLVLATYSYRIGRPGGLTGAYAKLVPRPELLGAMVIAMLLSGLFYETLHYRHGWALYGVIAALYMHGRREPEGEVT